MVYTQLIIFQIHLSKLINFKVQLFVYLYMPIIYNIKTYLYTVVLASNNRNKLFHT